MYSKKYLFLAIIILCWTINPYCKKSAITNITSYEYLIINCYINIILFIFIWILLMFYGKISNNIIKKMSKSEVIWVIVGSIITITSSILLLELIQNYDVSEILPQINPCIILLTLFTGYFFFNEKWTTYKCIGILLLSSGLYIINKK